ncbi:MAG: hypothetical protein ACTHLE_02380 [Agriterribacter sp.]
MRKLIIVFLIAFIAKDVSSQGDHFIYIQADNQRPFYVRSGSKLFQSSGEGYLVIPGLSASNYELFIGFSGTGSGTEWRFECAINEKDLGFTLKNNGSAPPQLIALRQKTGLTGTKVLPKEEKKPVPKSVQLTGSISDDPFSKMLANVVNDPTIRQQPVIIEKKTEPVLAASAKDSTKLAGTAIQRSDTVSQHGSLTAAAENKPAISAAKDNKPFVVKETPIKTDSTSLANAAAPKPQDNQPFVVREITKEPNVGNGPDSSSKKDSSKAIAQTTGSKNEPFVLKETINAKAKTADAKDSADRALTAKKEEPKPVASNNKPLNEPFVVKEVTNEQSGSPVVSNDASGKKTLPFTVQPQDKPVVVKEQLKADNKTAKKDNITVQPKNEPFVVKELPKTDGKAASSTATDNTSDQKTLPFTVQPKEEPAVAKELPKTDNKNQPNTAVNKPDSSKTAPAAVKEDKPFVLKETIAGKKEQPGKTTTVPVPAATGVTSSISIKKTLQRKSIDGIELIYVDEGANGAKDTIRILIPAEK